MHQGRGMLVEGMSRHMHCARDAQEDGCIKANARQDERGTALEQGTEGTGMGYGMGHTLLVLVEPSSGL